MIRSKDSEFWSAAGVTFTIGTTKDRKAVRQFLVDNFFPDEPVYRSTRIFTSSGFFASLLRKLVLEQLVDESLLEPHSIIAKNKDGKILGVKLGAIFSRKNPPKEIDVRWLANLPFGKPKILAKAGQIQKYLDIVKYGCEYADGQLPDNGIDKIFHGKVLCVGKDSRGLSLGRELAQRSLDLAKEKGCGFYYLLASGIYSQKTYRDLHFEMINEVVYKSYVDKRGRVIIDLTEEHPSGQLFAYNLNVKPDITQL